MSETSHSSDLSTQDSVDSRVTDAVINSYYPRVLAIGDSARTRVQAAYALVSSLAGGAAATFALTDLDYQPLATRGVACVAVALWLAAAAIYIVAVTRSPRGPGEFGAETTDEFIRQVIAGSQSDRDQVHKWQTRANLLSFGALTLTFATFATLVLIPSHDDFRRATLLLNQSGQETLHALCHRDSALLPGLLNPESLKRDFVTIKVDRKACRIGPATIRLPEDSIVAVRYAYPSSVDGNARYNVQEP